MSRFYAALSLLFWAGLVLDEAHAASSLELKTQTKIVKGSSAVFVAKVFDKSIKKLRIRYKCLGDIEYKWVDFHEKGPLEFRATIDGADLYGAALHYYVVVKKDDGSVENLYGSPDNPNTVNISQKNSDGLLQQSVREQNSSPRHRALRDRFGDDDIHEQIALFSAGVANTQHADAETFGIERIAAAGMQTLETQLLSAPSIEFKNGTPIVNGLSGISRLKLFVDELEVVDEYDGLSHFNLDMMHVAAVSLEDASGLGEIHARIPRKSGTRLRVRGGWPTFGNAALDFGSRLWGLDNYWTSSFRYNENLFHLSSVTVNEYESGSKGPYAGLTTQLFADFKDDQSDFRVTWNAGLRFDVPLSPSFETKFLLSLGQSFKPEYRVFRTALQWGNDWQIASWHQISLRAKTGIVSVMRALDLKISKARPASELRTSGNIALADRIQVGQWLTIKSRLEVLGALGEVNTIASALNPNAALEFLPLDALRLTLQYISSVRWPTFREKELCEGTPLPEKYRLGVLKAQIEYPTQYAHFVAELQAKGTWIQDALGPRAEKFGLVRALSFATSLSAQLAGAHQLYLGTEFHEENAVLPRLKAVLGARLNLLDYGASYIEVQSLSNTLNASAAGTRLHFFYQTRPFLDYFTFEILAQKNVSEDEFQILGTLNFSA